MTLAKHIALRGLRPGLLLIALLCALSVQMAFAQGGENRSEAFLGPRPGIGLAFRGQGGLRIDVWSEGFDASGGLLVTEEISGLQPDERERAQDDGGGTACSHYTLIAVGSRLLMKTPRGSVTLLDLEAEAWTVPLRTYGTLYQKGATGLCRIVSRTTARLFGRERTILDVECVPDQPNSTTAPLRFRFASGLGQLSRGGLHLATVR